MARNSKRSGRSSRKSRGQNGRSSSATGMSAGGRGSSEQRSTRRKNSRGARRWGSESEASEGRSSRTTTDHDEIREWAEQRGGRPACVKGTGGQGDTGIIRLEFPGRSYSNDDQLQEISWDEFFEKFDAQGLALVYQEKAPQSQKSNFNKLVKRETVRAKVAGRS